MCGRYRLEGVSYADMVKHFSLIEKEWEGKFSEGEVFPGTNILTVNNKREPEIAWWTIRDYPHKSDKKKAVINARSESVYWVDMFKDAFKKNRVLIPATSFNEWKNGARYKLWFDDPLFAFGGIARTCEIKGEDCWCTVIMTTKPNEVAADIHNRMPIFVYKYDYNKWLDPDTPSTELKRMMQPVPSEFTHSEKV